MSADAQGVCQSIGIVGHNKSILLVMASVYVDTQSFSQIIVHSHRVVCLKRVDLYHGGNHYVGSQKVATCGGAHGGAHY